MIHSAVNIRETQNSTSSAYYSIPVYNVVPTNNFFLYALIDIPMHVFVAVFIVITPRLHNSQNNFLFYDFVEREKRWRTVFPTDKNLSHFLWIKGETGGLVIVIVCARPCHTHTPKTSFLFGVCTFHRSLSFFRLETKSALLCQKKKDDGPQKIRKCVTFQISWKLLFVIIILNLCVFDRRIASREGHVA